MYQRDVDGLSDILIEISKNMKSKIVLFNVQGKELPIEVNYDKNDSKVGLIRKARQIAICDLIQQQGNPRLKDEEVQ